ncbi:MAG: ATP-binding protein [Collimonas sp.]|uniref:ATP-binding protein n=1 Tax=Collimonas sp. TaxID=1963772 RepID=UPI0032637387
MTTHPVLNVGIDADNAPTEYLDNGKYKGIASGYLDFIAKTTGLEVRLVPHGDKQNVRSGMDQGKIDLYPIVASAFNDALVGDTIIYTPPYYLGWTAVVTRPDARVTHHWEDLKGKTIALKRGAVYAAFLKENFPQMHIVDADSLEDALEAVADGRADATLGLDVVLFELVRKKFPGRLNFSGRIEDHPVNLGMGIRKDAPVLAAIIAKSLASISARDNEQLIHDWEEGIGYRQRSFLTLLSDYAAEIAGFLLCFVLVLVLAYRERLARRRAIRSEREKSMFLAVMSHEIRTPLNAIFGNLELLARSPLSERQSDRLDTVNVSSHAMLDILNDILDFSKAEAGQMRIETASFDLVAVVEEITAMFAPVADAKALNLYYTVEPALCRSYRGDSARVRQIIANLASNAIKFTETGKVTIAVRSAGAGQVAISVTDTGIGIAVEYQQEIFDAFSQADTSITRRFGGTGLGLALCKRLTELMGGTITVRSRVGGGSTFTVMLPLAAEPGAEVRGQAFSGALRLSLLCAAPEWRAAISAQLRQWGIQADVAEHPRDLETGTRPLLVFGNPRPWSVADENILTQRAPWIIDAIEDGPRSPVAEQGRIVVSIYSLDGLHEAIARASGQAEPESFSAPAAVTAITIPLPAPQIHMLVAEDNPANRELIQDQLEVLGYQADIVADGRAALRYFSERRYDVVLTDLNMPLMDGYTLAAFLRSQGSSVPIIAITAHAGADELQRCEQSGISGVLLKPMSLNAIDQTVRKHLKRDADPAVQSAIASSGEPEHAPLRADLLAILAQTCEQSLSIARDAIGKGDLDAALAQIHSIKGSFAMIQEHEVVTVCAQMEALGASGNAAGLADALQRFSALAHEALERRAAPAHVI